MSAHSFRGRGGEGGSINAKLKGPGENLLTCIASREPSEWKSLLQGSIYSLPTLPGSGSADPGEGISCSRAGMMAAYSSTSCSGSGWIILQEMKFIEVQKSIIFIRFIPARRPLSCILYRYPDPNVILASVAVVISCMWPLGGKHDFCPKTPILAVPLNKASPVHLFICKPAVITLLNGTYKVEKCNYIYKHAVLQKINNLSFFLSFNFGNISTFYFTDSLIPLYADSVSSATQNEVPRCAMPQHYAGLTPRLRYSAERTVALCLGDIKKTIRIKISTLKVNT